MKLHENEKEFKRYITLASSMLSIPKIYIEKDYWVTLGLKRLFLDPEISQYAVFKGGTSLSKCLKLIERFSEDVDVVIKREGNETDNQLKNKIKRVGRIFSEVVPESEVENLTRKTGKIRKTAHSYPQIFTGKFQQVRDYIVLEASWLGNFEPFASSIANSLVGELLLKGEKYDLIEKYEMESFPVTVLNPKRTLCEKVMGLVRFSYDREPIQSLQKKIRHLYDLHYLLKNEELFNFFNSQDFEDTLNTVAKDDVPSFKNNNNWLANHPKDALIFKDESIWKELDHVYNSAFSALVFTQLPSSEEIVKTLNLLKERINRLNYKNPFLQD